MLFCFTARLSEILGAGSGGFAGLGGYQARPLGSHIPAALWKHRPTRLAILAFVAHGDPYCRIFSLAAFSEIALILLHQMRDTRPDLPPVLELWTWIEEGPHISMSTWWEKSR